MAFRFDNSWRRDLPGSYLDEAPDQAPAPVLLAFNAPLAADLGLDPEAVQAQAAGWFSGATLPPGAEPVALAYAGHQFGGFSPQLGDGRAHLLGEHLDGQGRRWDIQLKGSGRTPFSRGGDGKAAVGPMLREFLISEAMAALGVPTTRSLAVVATGESIRRDGGMLPGAVVARVAAQMAAGWLEEVAGLLTAGHADDLIALRPLGYAAWMAGGDLQAARLQVIQETQAYAKRQATWFRNQLPEAPTWDPDLEPLEAALERLGLG